MTNENGNLINAIQTLSAVLEEISNQLSQIRFEMQNVNRPNNPTNQCVLNHECNDCGKCVIEGIDFPEVP